jgi:hypothetical protein
MKHICFGRLGVIGLLLAMMTLTSDGNEGVEGEKDSGTHV